MGIEENKAIVREYFRRMGAGDPKVAELMTDDVTWWVPQSSPLAGTQRGKASRARADGQGRRSLSAAAARGARGARAPSAIGSARSS